VYVWADGVYLQANAECMLLLIGGTAEGEKELEPGAS
jgi:hypothetical protein